MFKPTVRRMGMSSQVKPKVEREPDRIAVVKSATICVDGENQILPCTVRDIHQKGARFSVANPAAVPDDIMLTVRSENLIAKCKVSWRKGQEIGVRFFRTGTLADEARFRKERAIDFQRVQAKKRADEEERERIASQKSAQADAEVRQEAQERARLMKIIGLDTRRPYSESALKQAYRKQAMSKHPDHGGSMEAFTELNNTYHTLMNYLRKPKQKQGTLQIG